jgi:AcrR family transcriptional regulator
VADDDAPPAPRRRNERSRQAILVAAGELVAEVGYGHLTIEAIARRAGVGKQTIYRWWPSKGAVVLDAFMAAQQASGGATLPDTGDLEVDLRATLRGSIEGLLDPRFDGPYRALAADSQHDPALARDVLDRLLGPLLAATGDRLRAAQATGEVDADVDVDLAVELLYGPVFHRWLLRTRPLAPSDADALAALVVRALRPERVSAAAPSSAP